MMRKLAVAVLVAVLTLGMYIAAMAAEQKPITLKMDTTGAFESIDGQMVREFGRLLDERTGGKIKVQGFYGGALAGGSQTTLAQMVQSGAVEAALLASPILANLVIETQIISLPFFYKDIDHLTRVINGEPGAKIASKFHAHGIQIMQWCPRTPRQLTNSKRVVKTPEDIRGLKIRVLDSALHVDTMHAIGAAPYPMPWGETITALQLGTLDAQENPVDVLVTGKLYEVQKYVTLWDYSSDAIVMVINKKLYDSLSPDLQKIILTSAADTRLHQRKLIDSFAVTALNTLREKGMQIYQLTDAEKGAFEKKAQPVLETYAAKIGVDLVNQARGMR
jgi:tripartite ATP-independent transporter DctP family solute receptor